MSRGDAAPVSAGERAEVIPGRYLLLTRIPLHRTPDGRLHADALWAKDLRLHTDYLPQLALCCPLVEATEVEGLDDVTDCMPAGLFPLEQEVGFGGVLRQFWPNFRRVWRAARKADIVHASGAGWPFPLAFYLLPLRRWLGFQWVMVIESTFWMLAPHERWRPRRLLGHLAHSILLKGCVRRADARIFTQSAYRRYFLGSETRATLVAPATWVNASDLVPLTDLARLEATPRHGPLKLIFPTRMNVEKGVLVVLEALHLLAADRVPLQIAFMGTGDALPAVHDCQLALAGSSVQIDVLQTVPYGQTFFDTLRRHDAVLVANLKQEQPRIVFDAFSQGVPVIASDTSGLLDITGPDNALHFATGDAHALAALLTTLSGTPQSLRPLGLAGRQAMSGRTHAGMHATRARFLADTLRPVHRS